MFDTICTLPLTSDLFALTTHPTSPVFALGLATGHVQAYRLSPIDTPNGTSPSPKSSVKALAVVEPGCSTVDLAWRTRRHKGSCRTLSFSHDGTRLYSAGADGIVKAADTEVGRVVSKILIPLHDAKPDAPALLHALTPQTLLLATDSSALHLYDLRANASFASNASRQTYHPHTDYISALAPLAPGSASTSGFSKQWISVGGSTLALTDLRKGVVQKSEEQEEDLLSCCILPSVGVGKKSISEKIVVGGASGKLLLWERGEWETWSESIVVDRGKESLDALCVVPKALEGKMGRGVMVGMGDGRVRFVRVGKGNRVLGEVRHDDVEGVLGLGLLDRRMISGGGVVVKLWQESVEEEIDDEDGFGIVKRVLDSDEEDTEEEEESSEEEVERKRKKKRKRNKGKERGGAKDVIALKGID